MQEAHSLFTDFIRLSSCSLQHTFISFNKKFILCLIQLISSIPYGFFEQVDELAGSNQGNTVKCKQLQITLGTTNSFSTAIHFSLQSSHLNICYYHQDLHLQLNMFHYTTKTCRSVILTPEVGTCIECGLPLSLNTSLHVARSLSGTLLSFKNPAGFMVTLLVRICWYGNSGLILIRIYLKGYSPVQNSSAK